MGSREGSAIAIRRRVNGRQSFRGPTSGTSAIVPILPPRNRKLCDRTKSKRRLSCLPFRDVNRRKRSIDRPAAHVVQFLPLSSTFLAWLHLLADQRKDRPHEPRARVRGARSVMASWNIDVSTTTHPSRPSSRFSFQKGELEGRCVPMEKEVSIRVAWEGRDHTWWLCGWWNSAFRTCSTSHVRCIEARRLLFRACAAGVCYRTPARASLRMPVPG